MCVLLYMYVHGRIKIFFVVFHAICETIKTNVWKCVFVHNLSTFYPQCARICVLARVHMHKYWLDKYNIDSPHSAMFPICWLIVCTEAVIFTRGSGRSERQAFGWLVGVGISVLYVDEYMPKLLGRYGLTASYLRAHYDAALAIAIYVLARMIFEQK